LSIEIFAPKATVLLQVSNTTNKLTLSYNTKKNEMHQDFGISIHHVQRQEEPPAIGRKGRRATAARNKQGLLQDILMYQ
jgi:hypothetical protein